MISGPLVVGISVAYLLALFAVAWYGDNRAAQGRSVIANPTAYVLSMAVYCTSWTFYGSVGRAASGGLAFLPIYLGPTLVVALSGVLLAKMVRIGRTHRITSIADFIAARYGKSPILAGLVTVIAVVGIMPYISLQLKAVSTTFTALIGQAPIHPGSAPLFSDTMLLVALFLAAFAILFGARHTDASEHHEGMVLAIAFESVVKLAAFVSVGLFVTYGLHDGFADIFTKAAADPELRNLFTIAGAGGYGDWVALTILSMLAFTCLPRQFQVTVVENGNLAHVDKAVWLFPLYLLVINLFVLPIALAGRMAFAGQGVAPDLYVLELPLANGAQGLAVFVFLGGLSAAAGMIIVETIALAGMVSNDLVMPVLLRLKFLNLDKKADLSGLILGIRRAAIALVVLLGYVYVRLIGESYALMTIGLVSFCAAAQFAPALIGGILWKGATEKGALAGLLCGFAVWAYTLLLPNIARSGLLPADFVEHGPFGLDLLQPYALLGLAGLDPITHSLIWSMMGNLGAYIAVSLLTRHSAIERIQASLFVDSRGQDRGERSRFWRGSAAVDDLLTLSIRFIGRSRAKRAFADWAERHKVDLSKTIDADPDLIGMTETLLAGVIGTASARVMVASVSKGEIVGLDEVMEILDEASQIIAYSQKLEAATNDLKAANERLTELDRMKDDFISTVTHELRTPLTSIRSFSEILFDNPGIDEGQRQEFLAIVIKESERLTRLINQVLDIAKMESGRMNWNLTECNAAALINDSIAATKGFFEDRGVALIADLPADLPPVMVDADKFMQVVINLLSNAAKFAGHGTGKVEVRLWDAQNLVHVKITDDGPGIPPQQLETVFEKFRQVGDTLTNKPQGTGLGLPIARSIVEHFGGKIWAENRAGGGAVFNFTLPAALPGDAVNQDRIEQPLPLPRSIAAQGVESASI